MARFPALPLWTDALIGDTHHLTPAEFGAYLRLLIAAWRSPDCKLCYSDAQLGRIVGDPKNWHRLKPVVMAFWTMGEDGCFRQKRLSDERDYVSRQAAKSSAGGKAKSLKNRHVVPAQAMPNGCVTPAPTPTPTKKIDIVDQVREMKKGEIEKGFIEFYGAYPKKQKPEGARRAYEKALRKVSHEKIMDGLERAKFSDYRFRERQFTPMPSAWLNDGCYADQAPEPTNRDLGILA